MSATDERRDMKRKLTTIFCADVSGYSRMMGADEARTLTTLKEYREAIEGFIARHHGRVVSWSGDGLLAEFASVVEAVQCAAEVQRELKARNASRDEHLRMTFRIGINLGDVMADGDDIFGEGVNIAARLQQMAVPGGILISSPVYDQVRGKLSMGFAALGNQHVKNIAGEVSVYSVTMDGVTPHTTAQATASVAPPRWRDEEPAPEQPARRAPLFRRGLALTVDYCLVLFAVLFGALALNSTVDPNIVRMDLAVPFIDYGDIVKRTPWHTVSAKQEDSRVVTLDESVVTYEYMGLFNQTYRQTRTRVTVLIGDKSSKNGGQPSPSPTPAPAVDPAAPAQPVPPAPVPPPPPGIPEPAPSPPPPPDEYGIRQHRGGPDGTRTFSAGGVTVQIGPDGVRTSDGVVIDDQGNVVSGPDVDVDPGGSGFSFTWDDGDSDGKGSSIRVSHISEQLLDPATGKAITRPSLDMLSLILLVLYFTFMEMGRRGTTIGKKAFDMMVTREDGRPLGFANALARNAIKVLTSFILPIAVLVVLFSRRRQGIHDRLMETVVVQDTRN
ncbi:MAG: RDD family protein [Micropepsaceae bacterium]